MAELLLQKLWERDFQAGWVGKSSFCNVGMRAGRNGRDPERESARSLGGDTVDRRREKSKRSGGKASE